MATAFSTIQLLKHGPTIWYCYRGTFLRPRDLVATLAHPAVASIGAAAGTMAVLGLVSPAASPLVILLLGSPIYVMLYVLIWVSLPRGRKRSVSILHMIRSMLPSRPRQQAVS